MNFKHFPNRPANVTAEFIREQYAALTARIEAAESAETAAAWLELYADWNALKSFSDSEGSRRSHAQSKDMNDPEREESYRYYREEIRPVAENANSELLAALLNSRWRDAVGERYGNHLVDVLKTAVEPLAPINSDLRVKDGDLVTQYDKIVAGGEVTVEGKTMTLPAARSLMKSASLETRRSAFLAHRSWFLQHRDSIAPIFDQMVQIRHQMGTNLGHTNFVPLGYLGMGRTDYGPAEAAAFRQNVRQFVVPLQKKIYDRQAAQLGETTLKPWNVEFDPATTLPAGIAPVAEQLDRAERLFTKLSPELVGHFVRMRAEGLIDLENRKGKRAGAYCTSFSDEGRVAILCNSTGEEGDVGTLMHEMGHAFQGWESQAIEAVDLQWPTSDACEIHSMGMEYLSMRHMDEFFTSEEAEKFRRNRWKAAVEIICYICIVDEFQHWVYENPTATPDERDAAWSRIWDTYLTGIDYTGLEEYKYARWYAQGHIFGSPFYYIDYAIAETGAMQLALIDADDHQKAMESYLELCRIGGTKSVLNIFRSVGLRSPFDAEVMRDLMAHAAQELGIEEMAEAEG
ncbi:MAG: M3 family oligoendopeptidase [Chlorobi bacterium]|nr:MAG: Oligoendopeptidase F [Chlorobi bacterium OLB7]MBK8910528.1 M3 family oligoendopeptidase [Chlorobiota bacterium]MBX7216906.1 M3 family oligoendopeptidase [Candidatus Kapabacteria bacterium]